MRAHPHSHKVITLGQRAKNRQLFPACWLSTAQSSTIYSGIHTALYTQGFLSSCGSELMRFIPRAKKKSFQVYMPKVFLSSCGSDIHPQSHKVITLGKPFPYKTTKSTVKGGAGVINPLLLCSHEKTSGQEQKRQLFPACRLSSAQSSTIYSGIHTGLYTQGFPK